MINWRRSFQRLKTLSPKNIPIVIWNRGRRTLVAMWERHFYSRAYNGTPPIKLSTINVIHCDVFTEGFPEKFQNQFPYEQKLVIESADNFVSLNFDLLGSGNMNFSELKRTAPFDGILPWHRDVISGFNWDPQKFYADIRFGEGRGDDVKYPWELSRCHHFIVLGQAYQLTRDEKYAQAAFQQWEDWISQNPIKKGVNWSSPMDIALRACNWLVAWDLLNMSPNLPNGFTEKISSVLYEHGKHLRTHLEWGADLSTNHYISNLVGLLYLGFSFNKKNWFHFAWNQLCREIKNQTYNDGMDYEASLPYHRFVFEMFLYAFILRSPKGLEIPKTKLDESYALKLKSMLHVLKETSFSNGHIPQVGDNDSGFVHQFLPVNTLFVKNLISLSSLILEEQTDRLVSEITWIKGWSCLDKAYVKNNQIIEKGGRPPGDSGIAVIEGNADKALFLCMPNGTKGAASHTHNDKLSFILHIEGEDYFIDPGTGVYTSNPRMRNDFRATFSHTTVMIDDTEQNDLSVMDPFIMENNSEVRVLRYEKNKEIIARHNGYQRLSDPVIHTRRVRRQSDPLKWIIEDSFGGKFKHDLEWNFILSPLITPKRITATIWQLKGDKGYLEIIADEPRAGFDLLPTKYSPAYGIIKQTKKLRLRLNTVLPYSLIFQLRWVPYENGG